jgi:hypothetical protein
MDDRGKRAGPFETLGAWLNVWTPPRDVEVPPVPWRWLIMFGVPTLVVAVAGAWLIVDSASESNRERREAEERSRAALASERRRELRAEQAPERARVRSGQPRQRLVAALEAAVLRDARSRGLRRPVRRVDCTPHPRTEGRMASERDPEVRRGRYACLAVTNDIPGPTPGTIGYPFLAVIHYATGSLVWCRVNPAPGELVTPDPRTLVGVPAACRG